MDAAANGTNGEATYDVVVVGGGAAGLSGALTLSRARRSVLVIDAGSPRNAPASHVHNYLGREGTPPLELLEIGRGEVAQYGGQVVTDRVTSIERLEPEGFRVRRQDGPPVVARRLLVTSGMVDVLPDVDGLLARFGTDVLHCPYCHGWEVQDQPIVVLGDGPMAVHQALLWRQWTSQLTLLLHGAVEIDAEQAEKLEALGIAVVEGPAIAVEVAEGRLTGIELAGGSVISCDPAVVAPRFATNADLLGQLGLPPTDFVVEGAVIGTHIAAEPTGATEAPGIWVAGNVTAPMDTVISAAASAQRTAHMISVDLLNADAAAAVAARRAGASTS